MFISFLGSSTIKFPETADVGTNAFENRQRLRSISAVSNKRQNNLLFRKGDGLAYMLSRAYRDSNPAFCQSVPRLEVIYGGTASGVCRRHGERWDGCLPWPRHLAPWNWKIESSLSTVTSEQLFFLEIPGIFQRESFPTNLEILLK